MNNESTTKSHEKKFSFHNIIKEIKLKYFIWLNSKIKTKIIQIQITYAAKIKVVKVIKSLKFKDGTAYMLCKIVIS